MSCTISAETFILRVLVMNTYKIISEAIKNKLYNIPEIKALDNPDLLNSIVVEVPKVRDFGDYATNAAMVLCKALGKNPREVAGIIMPYIEEIDFVKSVSVAGPGFININVADNLWNMLVSDILNNPDTYGNSDIGGGEKVNVEFLSANPTGPVHIGHARGAILGDVVSRILKKNGYDVTKEYYVNDYGHQVDVLGNSIYWRYQELFGMHAGESLPEGCYPGDYLIPVAESIKNTDGDKWLGATESEYLPYFKQVGAAAMMDIIRGSLRKIGIEFDVFTSEKSLVDAGKVSGTIEFMKKQDLLYYGVLPKPLGETEEEWKPEEQLLFKATQFGDDVDRVIARANGVTTYFASDIAYHADKFERGFKKQINVWGADHGGYVKRIKSALGAVTNNQAELDVILCQLVSLEKDGKPFKMSKRAGNFVMIEDVLDEIDADVLRLFMVMKSADTQMTFDLQKAKEQSKDNPVYYIQYAYARACSVLKKFNTVFDIDVSALADVSFNMEMASDAEKRLIKVMADYPAIVESAGRTKNPQILTKYLEDLAASFHSLWSTQDGVKLIDENNLESTKQHMLLVKALKNVIGNGLQTLGANLKESM